MKRFIAGLLAGLVLGWLKRVKPCPKEGEVHTAIPTDWAYGSKVESDVDWENLEWINYFKEIKKSCEDTQPIRVRYTAEEIMPKRYPENKPSERALYFIQTEKGWYEWAYPFGSAWSRTISFIDIPNPPDEIRPKKYPENRPPMDTMMILHNKIEDVWGEGWLTKDNRCEFDKLVDWFIPYRLSSSEGDK